MNNKLSFTQYEQDALAALSQVASRLAYLRADIKTPNIEYRVAINAQLEKFTDVIDRFDHINWGDMYDKLHRTGANVEKYDVYASPQLKKDRAAQNSP